VFIRSGKFLVILALVLTTGAHWAALQTVAWTTMLANNLHGESFSEAVAKTFDGRHPCCLCKAIAAGKKSEKKSEATAPALKLEYPPLAGKFILVPPPPFEWLPQSDSFAESFSSKPPPPPPRRLFV
jgi:hypothetical protein